MLTSDINIWHHPKSQWRLKWAHNETPVSVQIAGTEPDLMARAAEECQKLGAQIIDINMGCPAKKVCNVMAGSALLQDESLVANILESVVNAVDVPVTLKIRTGWDRDNRNGLTIARIAEQSGIQALAIHGRTRADAYKGEAEYDTIAEIKATITSIPIIANGDIDSPLKAAEVLNKTGVDGLMIGRAAQGNPWIFRQILHYLEHNKLLSSPSLAEIRQILIEHLENLYDFYGDYSGVRMARKHIAWYSKGLRNGNAFRQEMNLLESPQQQVDFTRQFFDQLQEQQDIQAA